MPDPSLLILIPAYNEESRIEPVLRDYAAFFGTHYSGKFQIVVVLNGCRDNTLGVVQKVAADFPVVRALEFPAPIGKGGALIEGLKLAMHADFIGYADADGATSPAAFMELVKRIGGADCVIGSRWLPESVMHQEQPTLRRVASRTFHLIVELLFWMHIKDTQCPCKLMRREVVEKIHPALRIADLAFDVNLLVSIKRAGFKILEVPIEWTDKVGSKVSVVAVPLVVDDVFVRRARAADLLAVDLQIWIEPPVPPAGRLDLQKTGRAAAVARARRN